MTLKTKIEATRAKTILVDEFFTISSHVWHSLIYSEMSTLCSPSRVTIALKVAHSFTFKCVYRYNINAVNLDQRKFEVKPNTSGKQN